MTTRRWNRITEWFQSFFAGHIRNYGQFLDDQSNFGTFRKMLYRQARLIFIGRGAKACASALHRGHYRLLHHTQAASAKPIGLGQELYLLGTEGSFHCRFSLIFQLKLKSGGLLAGVLTA